MRIDKRLNLVIPIYAEEEDGGDVIAYVHSTPLAEEIIDVYFDVLGKTCAAIFSQGYGMVSGPGHAMRILRRIATEAGVWEDNATTGRPGVERGLVEEIRRLTNVAALVKEGEVACGECTGREAADCPRCGGTRRLERRRWEPLPLAIAVQRGSMSVDDQREAENAIVFFIAASATLPKALRRALLEAAAELWGAQLTSSPFTEWRASLRTSIPAVSTGENVPAPAKDEPASANAIVAGKPRSVPV